MRKTLLYCAFVLFALSTLSAHAQQALNNDSILKLSKAGLSDDLILSTIASAPAQFDLSTDGLIALKSAGLSDRVVAAMVARANRPATPAVSAAPTPTDPNDPASPHEAGIYAYTHKDGKPWMVQLEPSVYGSGKTSGVFTSALTYGIAKAKIKAVMRGEKSNIRLHEAPSAFYFYFENEQAGLSNANNPFNGTSTPNEYTLLRFEVSKDTRETIVGKFNAYGAQTGNDNKATENFTYEKLRPGVYKVTLKEPLKSGEYGFVAPSGAVVVSPYGTPSNVSGRVFDFGCE